MKSLLLGLAVGLMSIGTAFAVGPQAPAPVTPAPVAPIAPPVARSLSDESVSLLSALASKDVNGDPVLDQFQALVKYASHVSSGTVAFDANGNPTFTITSLYCVGEECFPGGTLKLIGDAAATAAGSSLVYRTELSLYH